MYAATKPFAPEIRTVFPWKRCQGRSDATILSKSSWMIGFRVVVNKFPLKCVSESIGSGSKSKHFAKQPRRAEVVYGCTYFTSREGARSVNRSCLELASQMGRQAQCHGAPEHKKF